MTTSLQDRYREEPLLFGHHLWPNIEFYAKQRDVIYSVRDNDETYVVAGNQLGKDFVAAYIALSFFLLPQMYFPADYAREVERIALPEEVEQACPPWMVRHRRRVVTTSVAEHHLAVLWGEISGYLVQSKVPLMPSLGGPLVVNHQEIRWGQEAETKRPMSYLIGRVSAKGEGMAGHHAPYTLFIVDEASGADDEVYKQGQGWAKKMLIFGNPNPCRNFFYRGVKAGDLAK